MKINIEAFLLFKSKLIASVKKKQKQTNKRVSSFTIIIGLFFDLYRQNEKQTHDNQIPKENNDFAIIRLQQILMVSLTL